jgi:CDP-paratose synthetase
MTKTILITGANGFLGKMLCKKLAEDYHIIPVIRNTDIELLFKQNKIDYIIHAATFYGRKYEGTLEFIESNILLPLKVCEYGIRFGSKAFINADTFLNQDYNYLTGYIRSKRQVNEWLKVLSHYIPAINMRIQHIYGPDDGADKFVAQIMNQLLNSTDIPLTKGEQKRDFIFIGDVVSAFQCVLDNINEFQREFKTIEVGMGKSISIRVFVETLHKMTNSSSRLLFGKLPYREGELMDSFANNYWLMSHGWQPKYDLIEGLKQTI